MATLEAARQQMEAMEADLQWLRARRRELEAQSRAALAAQAKPAAPPLHPRGGGPFPALHSLIDPALPDPAPGATSSSCEEPPAPPKRVAADPPPPPSPAKRRKLQDRDWARFWQDVRPLTIPKDPATEGMPTHVHFAFSEPLPVNVHGLFFHLASFGEVESAAVLSDVSCCAQFVRPRDAHRAQRACHLKLLSQLSTIVQVSGIDAALAAKCVLNVTFREAIPHANALVFFEPAPYEERLCALVHRFWPLAEARLLQTPHRRFLFVQFRTAADTHAALITLQLRLAFDWDIHVQYVSTLAVRFPGCEVESTADALAKALPFGITPEVQSFESLRGLLRQIRVGTRYKGVVVKADPDCIVVNIHIKLYCTVHVKDCDDAEAFRLLKVGDIIAPEVKEVVLPPHGGVPTVHMALQRPERCKPLTLKATLDALESQKQSLLAAGRFGDPAGVSLIHSAVRATYLQWATQ
eukprot:EG_transcript_12191